MKRAGTRNICFCFFFLLGLNRHCKAKYKISKLTKFKVFIKDEGKAMFGKIGWTQWGVRVP